MKKQFIMSLFLVMVLALGGLSFAGNRGGGMGMGMGSGMDGHHKGKKGGPMKFLKQLDLTQEQKDQVKAIMDQHQSEKHALRQTVKESGKALRNVMHADTFDEQAIRTASKTLSANMEEMAVLRGKIFSEVRTVLTPQQIEKLSELRAKHQEEKKCHERCGGMMDDDETEEEPEQ